MRTRLLLAASVAAGLLLAGCGSAGGPVALSRVVEGSRVTTTLSESRPLVGDVVHIQVRLDADPVLVDWPEAIGPLRRVRSDRDASTLGRYLVCDAAVTSITPPPAAMLPRVDLPRVTVRSRPAVALYPVRRTRLWPRWVVVAFCGLAAAVAAGLIGWGIRLLVRSVQSPVLLRRLRTLVRDSVDAQSSHEQTVIDAASLIREAMGALLKQPMAGATARTLRTQHGQSLESFETGLMQRTVGFLATADKVRYGDMEARLADAREGVAIARVLVAEAIDPPANGGDHAAR